MELPTYQGDEWAFARTASGSKLLRFADQHRTAPTRRRLPLVAAALAAALFCAVLALLWLFNSPLVGGGRPVLVTYLLDLRQGGALDNWAYFLAEAVAGDKLCRYVVLVQHGADARETQLPPLPRHAQYAEPPGAHGGGCGAWGAWGWLLLHSGLVAPHRFRSFLLVTSAARGPYLPAYARGAMHWTEPLTSQLRGRVRLVGASISCRAAALDGDETSVHRRNPHVQSHAVATDAAGLRLLVSDPRVLECHTEDWASLYYGEVGASAAVLEAGFNLGSLQIRYQGLDWRQRDLWECNGGLDPRGAGRFDGVSLDPLEVLFVAPLASDGDAIGTPGFVANSLEDWQEASALVPGAGNYSYTASNDFLARLARHKAPRVLAMRANGAACFDAAHYAAANPDLAHRGLSAGALWRHFLYYGQFEYRPFRMVCELEQEDYARLTGGL